VSRILSLLQYLQIVESFPDVISTSDNQFIQVRIFNSQILMDCNLFHSLKDRKSWDLLKVNPEARLSNGLYLWVLRVVAYEDHGGGRISQHATQSLESTRKVFQIVLNQDSVSRQNFRILLKLRESRIVVSSRPQILISNHFHPHS